jgi:hypothetical protein
MRTRMKLVIGAATTIVALILAAPAQAATAVDDQYGAVLGEQSGGGGQVEGVGGTGSRRSHPPKNSTAIKRRLTVAPAPADALERQESAGEGRPNCPGAALSISLPVPAGAEVLVQLASWLTQPRPSEPLMFEDELDRRVSAHHGRSSRSKVRHSSRVCDFPYNIIADLYNLGIDGDSETRTTSRRGSATFGDAADGEVRHRLRRVWGRRRQNALWRRCLGWGPGIDALHGGPGTDTCTNGEMLFARP